MVEHGIAQPARRLRPAIVSPALAAARLGSPASLVPAVPEAPVAFVAQAAHVVELDGSTGGDREVVRRGAAETAADRSLHAERSAMSARPDREAPDARSPECTADSGMRPVASSRFVAGPDFAAASASGPSPAAGAARSEHILAESATCGLTRTERVEALYKSFYHRVFCFARRSVADEEAEEVAHETFIRLLRVRNLETMSISVAYLLRIAENLLKRKHERAQRYRVVLERSSLRPSSMVVLRGDEAFEPDSDREFGAHGAAVEWFDSDRIQTAMCRLTSEEQAAVRLIVCEGLDYQAAARSMGVRVSTINNWKHRGLAKLKQLVGINRSAQPCAASAAG